MRLTTFLAFSLMIVGALGIVAARYFGLPKGLHLGIFAVGAGVLIGALESLYMRRMSLRSASDAAAAYDGVPAVIWGLMLLLVAGCTIGAAYALNVGRWNTVTAYLNQRPGALYVVSGLLLMGTGALAFVNPHGWRVWWKTLMFRVPRVMFAVLLVLIGSSALVCGIWEWLDPRDFQKASRVILSILESIVPDGWQRSIIRLLR